MKQKVIYIAIMILSWLAFGLLLLCSSCRTLPAPSESVYHQQLQFHHSVHIDSAKWFQYRYLFIDRTHADTVYVKDSSVLYGQEKQTVHDTVWEVKTDSIFQMQVEYIEQPLNAWQRFIAACGYILLGLLAAGSIYLIVKLIRKFKWL